MDEVVRLLTDKVFFLVTDRRGGRERKEVGCMDGWNGGWDGGREGGEKAGGRGEEEMGEKKMGGVVYMCVQWLMQHFKKLLGIMSGCSCNRWRRCGAGRRGISRKARQFSVIVLTEVGGSWGRYMYVHVHEWVNE